MDEGADEDENQVPAGDEVDPLFCGLEPGGLFEEFAAEKDEEEEKDGYEEECQSPFIGFVYFCPGGSEFLFFFLRSWFSLSYFVVITFLSSSIKVLMSLNSLYTEAKRT